MGPGERVLQNWSGFDSYVNFTVPAYVAATLSGVPRMDEGDRLAMSP